MSTYDAMQAKKSELESLSVEELETQCDALAEKQRDWEREMQDLHWALERARERRERERPDSLTADDEKELRRSLTVVGEMMAHADVNFGGFTLEDEEPTQQPGFWDRPQVWSMDIQTTLCDEPSPGLCINTTLKTKNARVRAIVREMITSTEHIRDEEKHHERTHWGIHWDYYHSLVVKNPMTSEMYYEKRK
jgi:hypothetical protein